MNSLAFQQAIDRCKSICCQDKAQHDALLDIIEHAQDMRQQLEDIVTGAVHPETAHRRVMVDLKPIRKVLDLQQKL